MADVRKILKNKFTGSNLYSNFGAVIKSITINGFRGMNGVKVDFEYPITAISGTNGAGKSTIGQLIVCGYKKPQTDQIYRRRYVKDFFPVSLLDPNPFTTNANVKFQYATNTQDVQELTVVRTASEWSGYKRQPERHSFYVGFALYIPKVERKDLSVYRPGSFTMGDKRMISDEIRAQVSQILNGEYEEVAFQKISHRGRDLELGTVKKHGYSYSENHMGFGEGRLLYMIDLFENEPDNSLFVLEEPETSLHEDAQYKFVKYLMDVCNRKRHQIIMSTHSSILLNALPPEGRKFIIRNADGVKVLDRVSAGRAKSILTDGRFKALTICVEDEFAKLLLQEAIRKLKPELLPSLLIAPMGDASAVSNSVRLMQSINIKTIGVRDADQGENVQAKLYKLPGTLPPEKEVYENIDVRIALNTKYSINISTILAGYSEPDHHLYGKILSEKACCTIEMINNNAIESYLSVIGVDTYQSLLDVIEQEMH
ncbi:MAG: ATP-dependent nuclease [Flavobacteriales bacterium]